MQIKILSIFTFLLLLSLASASSDVPSIDASEEILKALNELCPVLLPKIFASKKIWMETDSDSSEISSSSDAHDSSLEADNESPEYFLSAALYLHDDENSRPFIWDSALF